MNDVQSLYEIEDEQAANPEKTDPSYVQDFLQELIEAAEREDNMRQMSASDHTTICEMHNEANRTRDIRFERHQVYNRYWRPGKPLKVQIGPVARVESASYPSGGLPDEPKSVIGRRLKKEREERRVNGIIRALNNDNEGRLKRW